MSSVVFQSHLNFQRKLILEKREKKRKRERYVEEIKASEEKENNDLLRSALTNPKVPIDRSTQVLAIPSGLVEISLLKSSRVKRYREHLRRVITEAVQLNNASEVVQDQYFNAYQKSLDVDKRLSANPKLRVLSDKLCTLCQGGCCSEGGDHAYIRTVTIRRYMDSNPELTTEEIFDGYVSKLSDKTVDSSCINQTDKGCALPRVLRSDVCNGFYCDSLKSYQKDYVTSDATPVLVIQRANTNWNRFDPDVENHIVNVEVIERG